MTIFVVALLAILVPITALGFHVLQEWLEGWDQRRHAND
jgi:hypothetical protein